MQARRLHHTIAGGRGRLQVRAVFAQPQAPTAKMVSARRSASRCKRTKRSWEGAKPTRAIEAWGARLPNERAGAPALVQRQRA